MSVRIHPSNSPLVSSAIVLILLFAAASGVAQTATEPAGSGTLADPYQIATLENLYWIAAPDDVVPSPNRAERWAAHYMLTNDLDLAATLNWNDDSGWEPIGSMSQKFTGRFDGRDYTIRHLYINRPATANQGLFGYIQDAHIQNLRLLDSDLQVGHTSGGLAGYILRSRLEDIAVTGKIVSGGSNIGGVAGYVSAGTLHRVSVDANVQGKGQTAGLLGFVDRGSEAWHVYSLGTVTGTSSTGGLVGFLSGGWPAPILSDSYSRATVSGRDHVGGLIGYSNGAVSVTRAYSSGSVTGTGAGIGGMIGTRSGGTVSDCYWDMQASWLSDSAGGEGRTTAEMTHPHDATTYENWDFDTLWAADVQGHFNGGYPYLTMIPPMSKPVQILSPVRSGKLVVGDLLRFRGSALDMPNPAYSWQFGDGRSFAVREPGMVNFPATGIVTVSYAAPEWGGPHTPDTRVYEVVQNPGNLPDLRVMGVDLPPALAVGKPVQISYTVRNVGQGPATGWRDAVYLSRDAHLDIGDVLLGSADISHELAAGASYQGTLTVTLPGVDEGAWHLILVANDEWHMLELHRLNNEYAAQVTAQVPALVAGQSSTVSYPSGWVQQYFRMTATADGSILLDLSQLPPDLEVFVRFGALPTRGNYDYRQRGGGPLVIPAAATGDWYIQIFGQMDEAGDYDLRFDMVDIALTGSAPSRHGTETALELTLTGTGFYQPMGVELVSATGQLHGADEVEVDSFTQTTAVFVGGTIPAGFYAVRVTRNGRASELPGALEIVAGGEAKLETNLILPANIGYNTLATIYVEYANTGDATMPAPMLMLTSIQHGRHGAILTLEHHRLSRGFWATGLPHGFATSVQFLASGATPGLLQPGESARVPVYYAGWLTPWDTSQERPPIDWGLSALTAGDTTPADWAALKHPMRPDYVRADAWDVLWDTFTHLAGTTWGDYVAMLSRNASYLHRQGQRVEDVSSLLAFSMRLADGLSPFPVLARGMDAAVQGPGLPIIFKRVYLQPISRRFERGDLGRGWTHNWRQSLVVREDETVVVWDMTGTPRIFNPDSRYAGRYLGQPGDAGVLRAVDGGFRLTETFGGQKFYRDGKLEYIEDANGNRITCTYSGDRLTRLTHSAGGFLQMDYSAGRIASVTDHHGRSTQYDYTGEHLTSVQAYDGRTTTYAYHTTPGAKQHALTTIGLPDGVQRTYDYDERGRLIGAWRDDQREKLEFVHADAGRIVVTDALENSRRVFFDHWARVAKAENALGETVQISFDALGNPTRVTDPGGMTATLAYDRRGNLAKITDAMRRTTQFSYTRAFNQLAMVTDALGRQTSHSYDHQGNLISATYPDGSGEAWEYDSNGNPVTWSNRRGAAVVFEYAAAGRIARKRFADTTGVSYSYDDRGNLTEAENAQGKTAFTYDANDYLMRVEHPGGRWLAFSYDAAGRRTLSEDQLGHQVAYHYDATGRLSRLSNADGDIVRYEYDQLGRLERKTAGNGVYTTYAYDAAGRLLALENRKPDGETLSRFAYTYDHRSRRTTTQTHYGLWEYEYDDTGQLTRATLASTDAEIANQELVYEYDALGNRVRTINNGVETEYDTNALNQYTTVGDRTYTYDLDGNLIREDSSGGNTAYTYNDENRLVSVTRGGDVWHHTYDALGNRVGVDENGAVTHYVYDPIGLGNVVGEYGADGSLRTRYTHGNGLVNRWSNASGTGYYTFDPMGNASELTAAGGAVQNAYAYRPFGELLRRAGIVPNPFEFMGRFGVMADGTGQYYARARQYGAELGRFMAVEPLGLGTGDANLYRYAANSPIHSLDPTGLLKCENILPDPQMAATVRELARHVEFRSRMLGNYAWVRHELQLNAVRNVAGGGAFRPFIGEAGDCHAYAPRLGGGFALLEPVGKQMTDLENELRRLSASNRRAYCAPNQDPVLPPLFEGEVKDQGSTRVIASWDPNEKTTVAGYGEGNFVKDGTKLSYRIDFENYSSATAPAQIVTIRDPLSDDFDHSTLELAEFGFGDILFSIPPGLKHYQAVVDYAYTDDEYDFAVEVQVEIWLENGTIHFHFFTYDPETGMPPADASIGFLMPETDPATGRGRGFVSYLIRPKSDLPSGAEIRNVATIQFDFSLEIDTNQVDPLDPEQGTDPALEALVTFDSLPPASSVDTLPAITWTTSFPVTWSGKDDAQGSGMRNYDVFVRENDGPWTLWLADAAQSAAMYPGAYGNAYGFYCVATDNVGNRESKPETAEAVTMLVAGTIMRVGIEAGDGRSIILEFGEAETAEHGLDALDVLAAAGQPAHLICQFVPEPAGQPMTRDIRPIPDDGLTRWRLEVGAPSLPGGRSVHPDGAASPETRNLTPETSYTLTWDIDAAAGGREVWLQELDAYERPVGFPVDMIGQGELAGVAPGTVFQIVYALPIDMFLELTAGWNLVGSPVMSAQSAGDILEAGAPADVNVGPVWNWKAGKHEVFDRDAPFSPERGYWVYSAADFETGPITGVRTDGVILLKPGWNLVSPAANRLMPDVDGITAPAWRWDSGPSVYRPTVVGDTLEAGQGYWIYVSSDAPVMVDLGE